MKLLNLLLFGVCLLFSGVSKSTDTGMEDLLKKLFVTRELDNDNLIYFIHVNQGKKFEGPGITAEIEDWLEQRKYKKVLKHLWSEESQEIRIKWLKEKANEGYALFMLELAKEYGIQGTKEEDNDLLKEGLVWYEMGMLKVVQDMQCYEPKTASELNGIIYYLENIYLSFFPSIMDDLINGKKNELRKAAKAIATEMFKKFEQIADPFWMGYRKKGILSKSHQKEARKIVLSLIDQASKVDAIVKIEGNIQVRICLKCKVKETNVKLKNCSRCLKACYCSAGCQTKHWPEHKETCKAKKKKSKPVGAGAAAEPSEESKAEVTEEAREEVD